ncbi:DNA transfer protein [Escherichia phage vB-Eco-KMB41]|nr:DNA transfer protein [Escherichia phage vB-Eco-KMB41]
MGGAISGIGGAVSSVLGGIGTNKALKQQQKATDKQMDYQRELQAQQAEWLSPFREAGTNALPQLTAIAGQPIDREQLLSDYYGGKEFAMNEDAARRTQLASAEATGGLGSTATQNGLAAIAPTLGQNYLNAMQAQQQDMFNQLLGLTNVGLSGAGAQSAAATGTTNALTALAGQKGQILGQKAALPWNTAATANNQMSQGAAQDANSFTSMFGGMFGGMI